MHPSGLDDHRISNHMPLPCCLCPLADENEADFVEAAVYRATSGPLAGQYVASCARELCGYFGKYTTASRVRGRSPVSLAVVHMERLYNFLGLYITTYPPRGMIRFHSRVGIER